MPNFEQQFTQVMLISDISFESGGVLSYRFGYFPVVFRLSDMVHTMDYLRMDGKQYASKV